ncbi:MAG: tetratricopeptide repeat protein [Deltaproteobacteria bacterium]
MAVLVEALSVVCRIETITEKYPGGVDQYIQDCPNGTLCKDDKIVRVGFMSPDDVNAFIENLERLGFRYVTDGEFDEIAVVDQFKGINLPCAWLEFGNLVLFEGNVRVSICTSKGKDLGDVVFPCGWDYETSLSKRVVVVESEDADKRMTFLRREDGVDFYLDTLTGEEVFIGRTTNKKSAIMEETMSKNNGNKADRGAGIVSNRAKLADNFIEKIKKMDIPVRLMTLDDKERCPVQMITGMMKAKASATSPDEDPKEYDGDDEFSKSERAKEFFCSGDVKIANGDYQGALEDLSKAISLDQQSSRYYSFRGVAYYELGRYEEAIADEDKSIDMDPSPSTLFNRSEAYYKTGRDEEALRDLHHALKLAYEISRNHILIPDIQKLIGIIKNKTISGKDYYQAPIGWDKNKTSKELDAQYKTHDDVGPAQEAKSVDVNQDGIKKGRYNCMLPFSDIPSEPLDKPSSEYPYLVVRLMSGVYQRERIYIRQGEAAVYIGHGSCFLRHPDPFDEEGIIREGCRKLLLDGVMAAVLKTRLRMCVVWAPDKASFVEMDKTINESNEPPSGGITLPSKVAFDTPMKAEIDSETGNIKDVTSQPKH